MLHKRQKAGRYRGSKTHGCGSMKKRRGKGNKGGCGNAGSGKRADQKKPSFWGEDTGKKGFVSKTRTNVCIINLSDVNKMIAKGTLKEKDGVYDLSSIGYNKLLSKGKPQKFKIKVEIASEKLINKVKEVGGEIIISATKKENKNNVEK
jgi:large subunit ribosomal protein L15